MAATLIDSDAQLRWPALRSDDAGRRRAENDSNRLDWYLPERDDRQQQRLGYELRQLRSGRRVGPTHQPGPRDCFADGHPDADGDPHPHARRRGDVDANPNPHADEYADPSTDNHASTGPDDHHIR